MNRRYFKRFLFFVVLMMPSIVNAADYLICGNDKKIPLAIADVFSLFLILVKIFLPLMLVIVSMISFLKALFSQKVDEDLASAKSKLIRNIVSGFIIFFAVSIVSFSASLIKGKNNEYMSCISCVINSDNCPVGDADIAKLCPGLLSEQDDYDENCVYQGERKKNIASNTSNSSSGNTSNSNNSMNQNNSPNPNYSTTFKKPDRVDVKKIDGATYMNGILIVNKSYSIPSSYRPSSANGQDNCALCLDAATLGAFNEMKSDASSQGISLNIVSGFRSYNFQKQLYQIYVNRDGKAGADRYSARPGNSEHQTGLAFDVNQASDSFANTPAGNWVNSNCYKYGFIIRYPYGKTNYTGFKYESWHLRYVGKELAALLYNNGNWVSLEEYFGITSEYNN